MLYSYLCYGTGWRAGVRNKPPRGSRPLFGGCQPLSHHPLPRPRRHRSPPPPQPLLRPPLSPPLLQRAREHNQAHPPQARIGRKVPRAPVHPLLLPFLSQNPGITLPVALAKSTHFSARALLYNRCLFLRTFSTTDTTWLKSTFFPKLLIKACENLAIEDWNLCLESQDQYLDTLVIDRLLFFVRKGFSPW